MNRFLRPISVIALFQELAVFGCLIVTATIIRSYERFGIGMENMPSITQYFRHGWFLFSLIPLIWVVLAALDEDSEDPILDERYHFWIGVGLLVLLTWIGITAATAPSYGVTWGMTASY